ncbi:recQ-mediated genome instability protein 1 [Sarcophilus harrisii]|uniref:RecQ-mediated genome instability protein 1 n=1 Tax=Sarcophilus harrisii TaxID=9305 RepID=G3WXI9_SARHA|nr:recQ-mediated genome instability protein 1 [Sarcophilus harrisii]XP_023353440.1 recQ-mediated genome instability protein 1 [Sarcophilus harrisii]XP_031801323.1 recQ-mediated genome instability protein 1 [Sarcophilus harrisii]XP_031801324.1 recQ-mediated genome instability protein 1 [Sarcophilus harrisii]XP_031801325.1 recQ-mediated genome instability protein 1 [Sarcophilus harrisii]XP_031801326.1 recQ-mediated genome instability protein 1 [Sarcophilus harrisii]XP_031801327.1 recQ-mediated 
MNMSSIALRVETWLSSAWHIKVPMTWLEACITWIQEENNDVSLTQAQMNKQVFDQWLLTDLRDLEYPILPDKILEVPKGELSGFYSLQINSLVDVSQPMYSQLQKLRGLNRSNDQVTAETQISLKPWEANPTRMLMLQITDGVRQIQGMEYQPIPALHQAILPGTKILIHGKVSYRLGVLLLKPENVKVLGGEVDALVEEHAQERILARLIGEPDSLTSTRSNHSQCIPVLADGLESALEPSDEELLASLDENESIVVSNDTHLESGYFSRSISDSISNVISSSGLSCITPRKEENLANPFVNFTEGDVDDFSLEDVLFLEETVQKELQETEERNSLTLNRGSDKNIKRHSQKPSISEDFSLVNINEKNVQNQKILFEQITSKDKSCSYLSMRDQNPSNILSFENNAHLPQDFIVKHKSSDIYEKINPPLGSLENYMLNDKTLKAELVNEPKLISEISNESSYIHPSYLISSENNLDRISIAVNLDSPPFTYISVLLSRNLNEITTVKVKAFIVTLTGNLSGCGGFWSITAKISDGTAYLDVTFADEILTNMIGFSVSEMKQLKKDNSQHKKLQEGLQKCQRALIDLCCLMTITFNPSLSKGIVSVLQDVNMEDLQNLRRRLNK